MTKYFLDTNVFVRAIVRTDTFSERLFFDRYKEKLTNEYVIREVRKILKTRFGYSEFQINGAIDSIRLRCEVCSNPPPNRFKKIEISDKSDKPIVQGAIDNKCTLVTGDYNTYHDAKKYIKTKTAEEIYKKRK